MAVTLSERNRYLRQNTPNKVLLHGYALKLGLFDDSAQVAALTKLHHNVQFCRCLVNDSVIVPNDVWMAEFA